MFPIQLYRLTAWTAILSGLFIMLKKLVVELLLPLNPAANAVGSFGLLLGLFTLTGIYVYQRQASGRLGLIGYLVNWFGLALVSGVDYAKNYILPYLSKNEIQALLAGPTKQVFLSCATFFLVGVILFSAASLRARVFPRLAVLLYLMGFTLYSLSFLLPDVVVRIAEVGGALGVIWLGYALLTALRKTTTRQPGRSCLIGGTSVFSSLCGTLSVEGGIMTSSRISAEDPNARRRVAVLDTDMAYLDVGTGDPIVFLHGNPTSSYLWRNIIPHLEGLGRCLAPDLVGMGESGKAPRHSYRFVDHARYLDSWFEGSILTGAQRAFCRSFPQQEEITVKGFHFIQEDSPTEIGMALADFVKRTSA